MGYIAEGPNITVTSEEDTRLCRLANEDFDNYDEALDNQTKIHRLGQHLKKMRLKCGFQDYRGELIRTADLN